MSGSKYEYVRTYEKADNLLPNTYLLVRIDGHAFHKFSDFHKFRKPNDVRALELADRAARSLMDEYPDIVLGFGESDEYSFLIRRSSNLYSRRESKVVSLLVSLFTSSYVYHWSTYFPPSSDKEPTKLLYPPTFDGRIVCYPTEKEVRDYFAWRQVDTHINNLYNTTFWSLVQLSDPPLTTTEAHQVLKGTLSKEKNEILFSKFAINYAKLEERYRKGSILVRDETDQASSHSADPSEPSELSQASGPLPSLDLSSLASTLPVAVSRSTPTPPSPQPTSSDPSTSSPVSTFPESQPATAPSSSSSNPLHGKLKGSKLKKALASQAPLPQDGTRGKVVVLHVDLIKDEFWAERPWLLA